ncbi:UDP-N-acetylmuramoyl-tripeptide--D-alanyl-D-alanine ligase [Hydromonas duriensis]|uniref:UDP-N-acetylmuramoyl-tripeptide--D-alanyl-D-alanine ligase n=1 Tax=Hydromonas duriensis TaxID=1527608 RepID=A0A4R6Y606_9BURK|nr:UDP-N-acetylmuramoyl-tripeptide--D-alanyl-D-alanine ligase [Hydromonas duriensis]TDR30833.1 UDP-N-acetylmuramoyl-tripeptide--D-alanyl-D-alanine ligase [Hydromonas duriensis]
MSEIVMGSLAQVANWVKGAQVKPEQRAVTFDRVSTDTRTVQAGDLFIALKGERFDAHDFLSELQVGDVAAVIASRVPDGFSLPYVLVTDTRVALQELSHGWRSQFNLPLVVVTGSNGKTTVKEMIASILNQAYDGQYLATRGNLNNDIGLPMTLLHLTAQHKAAVIELGMNHPGETAELAPLASPTVALINNAQREHQEFMQTVEAVAQEHAHALDALPANGMAVFPADDAHAEVWRARALERGLQIFDFSIDESVSAAFTARYELGLHASTIQLMTPQGQCTTQINIPGVHNVHNALAACAAASAMGISLDKVAQGLAAFVPAKGRLQTHRLADGVTLIDDTYNANPDSVRAAIDVLASSAGRKILVLGDMGEVGDQGQAFHEEVGAYAKAQGIDVLVGTGDLMRFAVTSFGMGAQHTSDVTMMAASVVGHMQAGAAHTILIKGSRFMGMERVVAALLSANESH